MLPNVEGMYLPQSRDIKYSCKSNQPLIKYGALVMASWSNNYGFYFKYGENKIIYDHQNS